MEVRIREETYPVLIGSGLLGDAGNLVARHLGSRRVAVVADAHVAELHGRALRASLRRAGISVLVWSDLPAGERAKTLARARSLYESWVQAGVDRATPVLILGGGAVGDVGAYAASTFQRGLPVVQIPTSVVAQVDSSVGGKTAVNFARAKNLIGTFHQPRLVLSDPQVLATLPERDFRAGLAEAVKIGVTLRPDLFLMMEEELPGILRRDPELLARVALACVSAKGEVVGRDEREEHVRAILNYGHTVGHALEAVARGGLRHGEAVAIGMNAAAWMGERLGVTANGVRDRQNALLTRLGLKLTRPGVHVGDVFRNLKLDKKMWNRKLRVVLTLQVGGASVWPQIPDAVLKDAVGLVSS